MPDCKIVGKEAVSAINRAKTQQCKKHLSETTCKVIKDVLYPKRLPRFCVSKGKANKPPHSNFIIRTETIHVEALHTLISDFVFLESTYMKYIGCFRDEKKSRLLTEHYILQKETNSPQNCIDVCLQSGFPYAGVQYS